MHGISPKDIRTAKYVLEKMIDNMIDWKIRQIWRIFYYSNAFLISWANHSLPMSSAS
jgi:hypothetical protein